MREYDPTEYVLWNALATPHALDLTASEFGVLSPLAMELCLREDAPEDHPSVTKWFGKLSTDKAEAYKRKFVALKFIEIADGVMRLGERAGEFVKKDDGE